MAVSLKHKFQSAKPNGADSTLIQPSNWNDEHALTLGGNRLLGRVTGGNGDAEEIPLGSGLAFSSGALVVTGKASSGVNNDITELQGLTTPLSVTQGGTGGNTQAAARAGLGLGAMATKTKVAVTDLADLTAAKRVIGSSEASQPPTELVLGAGLDVIGSELRNVYGPWRGQAINIAPVDSNGLPAFIPASSGALSITTTGVSASTPLVLTANQGIRQRVAVIETNQTFSGLFANSPNFVYFALNANGTVTPGATALAPIYQLAGTPSIAAGQFTYNIIARTMYMGDGSSANPVYAVFVGEVYTTASAVNFTIAYAVNGKAKVFATLGGNGAMTAISHNIGQLQIECTVYLYFDVAQSGFQIGNIVEPVTDSNGTRCVPPYVLTNRNFLTVGWNSAITYCSPANAFSISNTSPSGIRWFVVADRGWD